MAILPTDNSLLAAIDIGTNSVRMSLVRLDDAARSWTVVSEFKETVRLGQDEFVSNRISEAATARGVLVLSTFAGIARGYGATELVAIGTAALREAENRDDFIERVREQTGIEVQVVSGVEEARLIYLGVASGIEIGDKKSLFIDIGGGSTELIIGSQSEHFLLESLKLGAIRVGNRFLEDVTGPIPTALYETMRQYARGVGAHALRRIREIGFEQVIASSGTAMNLARVAAVRAGLDPLTLRNYVLRTPDLIATAQMLCGLSLEERRKVPGLNPERADIIISGAAVLQTLAEDLDIEGFVIADRSLREGVLVDALLRRAGPDAGIEAGVRRRSIDRLLRLTEGEAGHAQHVARLTLSFFDQMKKLGLHNYGPRERELLEYAALLHDIGVFISLSGHHRHSYYLIRHSQLAGFTDEETQVIANLAYFHRKSAPKKRHAHFQSLSPEHQRMVRKLSVFLRLAEGLDRSHLGLVKDVRVRIDGRRIALKLETEADPRLEIWYIGNESPMFEEAFGLPLVLESEGETAPAIPTAV